MECILNCGIQPGEFIELAPAQHLITAMLVYGKETVKVDIKQTTTISGLKNLLFTVYLAAASGRSPALPCFAAFLALVRFSGLFAFTQLFFQTRSSGTGRISGRAAVG